MDVEHPFLSLSPNIKWSLMTAARFEEDVDYAIELANQKIETICNTKDEEICFSSVFEAYDKSDAELSVAQSYMHMIVSTHETNEFREAYNKVLPKITEFSTSIVLNSKLWEVIKKAEENSKAEDLTRAQRHFIEIVVNTFKKNGADLPDEKKERIKEIDVEISLLTTKYAENIKDSMNKGELYITNEEDLRGLPQTVIKNAKNDAIKKGKPDYWRFTLQNFSLTALMKYLENEEIRHQMDTMFDEIGRVGEFNNGEIVKKVAALRDEKAHILGFDTYADLVTKYRMAGSGKNAIKFVEDFHDKLFDKYMQQFEELKAYISKKNPSVQLKPWNVAYWKEKQRKEFYDFDDEQLKPYFVVQNVLNGLFKIFNLLYNVEIREKPTYVRAAGDPEQEGKIEVLNEDVRFFEVFDIETSKVIGGVYADMFPREDKRSGAWVSNLSNFTINDNPTIVFLNTNVTKPIDENTALITHANVRSIFHEFGHAIHDIFYRGSLVTLGSSGVPWDFVEVPSKFNENFIWEREALDLFAKHYQTGETIPDDLYKKLIESRNYCNAMTVMGQLRLSRLDLAMHQEYEKYKDCDLETIHKDAAASYSFDYGEPTISKFYNFRHIFGSSVGYSAGYYSYKWADVIAADCFSKFKKEGVFNRETGLAFRNCILSQGYSIPVQEEFRNFMGRDPSQDALLKVYGLL